ncbi:MAG: sugar phosphate nucleotidyltransferase [Candidatus Omnitrophica bacterium]|jgi:NDP-sugar pyrophosphorylase family protein|nr:sugar phosphate nucleotidyltransferase [Candidatus Omnitrophota bacterium]
MQIIIPMSGTGQRFLNAGYSVPKPLIEVDEKPIIEHVVNLFPKEGNFIFVCNNDHLKNTNMRAILKRIAPKGEIYGIPTHKKGPVYAVSVIQEVVSDDKETIINYCDFSKRWNYHDFLKTVRAKEADGAISAYRGFHPHMLNSPNYAFIKEESKWMIEIREKLPFTDDKMQEYASDGTYYFKYGKFVKRYFKQLMDENINTSGEFYVSMVYNLMKRDGLKIAIYEIEHMLQWGTPRDLEEYKRWSVYFKSIAQVPKAIRVQKNSINLIPLAGRGSRFSAHGYTLPKPLIKVNGKSMIIQAASHLPRATKYIFICLADHLNNYPLKKEILKVYPKAKIVGLDKITEGQACTCELGLSGEDLEFPLLIGACDNGMVWDARKYESLITNKAVDSIIWCVRHYLPSERNPQMYSWLRVDKDDNVLGASVKVPVSDNSYNDYAMVGTFYFKKAKYFIEALKRMREKNIRVNNEFYVDSCVNELIAMRLGVKAFGVDYICWGTPDELHTYEYWQSFFHKCPRVSLQLPLGYFLMYP